MIATQSAAATAADRAEPHSIEDLNVEGQERSSSWDFRPADNGNGR